jgi:ABC-type dipeptide/oligopeptide/nickel transport system ATPase component
MFGAVLRRCGAGRLKRQSSAPAGSLEAGISTDHIVVREFMAEPFPDVPLLDVRNLATHFLTDRGVVRAVDGVSLHINAGETLGVVGESGSGKSVTALSIMRLIREPPGHIASGEVRYNGVNLLDVSAEQMRKIRGKEIAMIFQEPMTSLNPVFTVGEQIAESIRLHEGLSRRDAADKSIEMLRVVHIPNRNC